MEEQVSRIKVSQTGGVSVVELTDRKILDEVDIAQIRRDMSAVVDGTSKIRLVLDFVNVDHMSSSALSMLITLHKHVKNSGGRLLLCNIRPPIYEAFTITRLNEVFEICADRNEAVNLASS